MPIRTAIGMPPDNESGIDKSDPRRSECADCKHADKSGTEYPCILCWNPIGDLFDAKVKKVKTPRTFVTCKCCNGAGEIETPNVQIEGQAASGLSRSNAGSCVNFTE